MAAPPGTRRAFVAFLLLSYIQILCFGVVAWLCAEQSGSMVPYSKPDCPYASVHQRGVLSPGCKTDLFQSVNFGSPVAPFIWAIVCFK